MKLSVMADEISIKIEGHKLSIDFNFDTDGFEMMDIMANAIGIMAKDEPNRLSLLIFAMDILQSYVDTNDILSLQPEQLN